VERWERVMAVQRMQDFIEAHMNERITLPMLARAAGYSPFHSARMFREMTGQAPFSYIRALRLSRAAERLCGGEGRIVDVALDFVFDSHEGFTRAFSRQFGMSPQRYRRERPPLRPFLPEHAREYYLRMQKGERRMSKNANTVFVQVVDRPARKLILKRGVKAAHYFEYCEEVGCGVWDVLSSVKDALYEPIGMWLPDSLITPGTSVYAQGVEVPEDYAGPVPEGYEVIGLAPCKMMVFQGPPFDDAKFEEAIGGVWEAMQDYDPKLYGFEWADGYGPRFQLAPMGYRGYIEARPVRQLNAE
jgi:AraC family transcriptional regulator